MKRRGVLYLFVNRRFYATSRSRQSSRSPEVLLYRTKSTSFSTIIGLVALVMGIHFLAIDKSNVAEGIARSWTKAHPSFLPRQPEATIHCNAASVRPARVLESASPAHGIRGIFSSTLALKGTRLETRHQVFQASVIDHATHAPAIVPTP